MISFVDTLGDSPSRRTDAMHASKTALHDSGSSALQLCSVMIVLSPESAKHSSISCLSGASISDLLPPMSLLDITKATCTNSGQVRSLIAWDTDL